MFAVSENGIRLERCDVTNLRFLQAAQAVFCFLGEPPGAEGTKDLFERDPVVGAVSAVRVAGMVAVVAVRKESSRGGEVTSVGCG